MIRSTLAAAGLILLAGAPSAFGQIIPPAPEATPAAPAYTPPPPPAPAPAQPAQAAVAAPDLVKKDAAGKVMELSVPLEVAAVDALNLPPDRRSKVEAVKVQRRAEMDGTLVKACSDALLVRSQLATLDKVEFNDLIKLQKPLQSVTIKQTFVDKLTQQGALTPAEGQACKDAVAAYGKAMLESHKEQGAGDVMKIAAVTSRYNIRTISREAMIAMDDLLGKLAAKTGKSKEEVAATLAAADVDTQMKMLVSVSTPMPMTIEPPKPADATKPAAK